MANAVMQNRNTRITTVAIAIAVPTLREQFPTPLNNNNNDRLTAFDPGQPG